LTNFANLWGKNLQNFEIKKIEKKNPWLCALVLAYSWIKINENFMK